MTYQIFSIMETYQQAGSGVAAQQHIEIMAPVGSYESLSAAIQAGADAVYFGVGNLNMRSRSAANFSVEDLRRIAETAQQHGVRTYLTVNTIIYNDEIEEMHTLVQAAKEAEVERERTALTEATKKTLDDLTHLTADQAQKLVETLSAQGDAVANDPQSAEVMTHVLGKAQFEVRGVTMQGDTAEEQVRIAARKGGIDERRDSYHLDRFKVVRHL